MPSNDQPSRLFFELCALLLSLLRTLHFAPPPPTPMAAAPRRRAPARHMSPTGFATLLLGASLALMLCGSVTFVIGFLLLPWVIGLVMLFNFVGIVSNLSRLGRAVLYPSSGPSSPKDMSGPLFSKLPII